MRVKKEPLMRLLLFARTHGCVAAVAVCAATTACAGGERPTHTVASEPTVDALIGRAACESDAQCRTVAVGSNACGGPQRYLAWSIRSTEAVAVARAADRSVREANTAATASGILSTCRVVSDPGAHCVRPPSGSIVGSASIGSVLGRCQLRAGTGTAGRAD